MVDEQPTLDPTPHPDHSPGHGSDFIPPASSPARMPKQIGKFRIKKLIATGGMGAVYQGVQEQPRRTVAIKLMKSGVTSASALRRFEYESQLLARLRHPGIAEVYDAGTHQAHDGAVPYFVMEYIAGAKRITDYVRDKKLGTRERLTLFLEVARAVHHGHTKGIIHRDLKPDNILVDSHGRIKVIDFGVARATDSDLAVTTLQTDIGQLIGTVQYMSPEQVEAEPDDLDTRSDVYSLGVVLYEMLCGKLPYDVSKMKIYDATRVVRETEAMKLSTIDSTLRGDVETIVAKALEKDRERRYQTAQELTADIERYLKDEAIMARPASLTYQVRVFARRNKAVVIGVAAVFGALFLGLAGMSYLYVDTIRARNAEADQREFAERKQAEAEAATAAAEELAQEISAQKDNITQKNYYIEMAMAGQVAQSPSGLGRVQELTDNWLPDADASIDRRGWEWYYLRSLLHQDIGTIPDVHVALWTDNGVRIGFSDREEGSYTVKDDTGRVMGKLPAGSLPYELSGPGLLSPDAKRHAVLALDDTIQIWDLQTGLVIVTLPGHGAPIDEILWSPDGVWLASAAQGAGIRIWNTHTGDLKIFNTESGADTHHLDAGGEVEQFAWAPDNKRLAVNYAYDNRMWIIDIDTGINYPAVDVDGDDKEDGFAFDQNIRNMAWNQDSPMMAIGVGKDIVLLNSQTFEITQTLTGHRLNVYALAWGPNGQLASGSLDRTVKLWNTETGQPIRTFRGHTGVPYRVAWNPEGTRLISTGYRGAAKIWDVNAKTQSIAPPPQKTSIQSVAWGPNGRLLVFDDANHALIVWDTQVGAEVARFAGHQEETRAFAWSPDGTRIASCSRDKSLRIWNPQNGDELKNVKSDSNTIALAWSPDGAHLVTSEGEGLIKMRGSETFEIVGEFVGHETRPGTLAWSHDGKRIASRSYSDKTLRVWNPQTRKQTHQINGKFRSMAWNPDGRQLATASFLQSSIEIWHVGTTGDGVVVIDDPTMTLEGHTNGVLSVSWNIGGDRIASASDDGTAKIWDAVTGKLTMTLTHLDSEPLEHAAWSPNGQRLVTVSEEGVFEIWDASKGYAEERLRKLNEPATSETTQ